MKKFKEWLRLIKEIGFERWFVRFLEIEKEYYRTENEGRG